MEPLMTSPITRTHTHDEPLWTTKVEAQRSVNARLTVEVVLYAILALAGLALRLAALGRWPLLQAEAETALAALRTVRGSPLGPLEYTPLLYNVNLVLFSLTRATDASTRLLPALLGSGLVVVPFLARDVLGRRGALIAAALLAFSPTWVFFSRAGLGSLPSAASSALFLVAGYGYWRTQQRGYAYLGAASLGLGLTAGPGIYTLLVSAPIYGLVAWVIQRRRGASVSWVRALCDKTASLQSRQLALVLGAIFVLSATAFTLYPGGLGATINLAGRWASDLAPKASGLPWHASGRNLLTYESLTVALACVGAAWGLSRKEPLTWFALSWLAVALLLGSLLGHRDPRWSLDALLPLVILAARGFEFLWTRLVNDPDWRDGVALWLAFCFLIFGFLELASYAHNGQREFLWYALISWGVLLAALAAQAFWTGIRSMLRVGAALLILALGLLTVRSTTAIAYQTGRDPREGLVYRPTSVQVRDLEAALRTTSYHQIGDPTLLDVEYEADLAPLVEWTLRDYANARVVPGLTPFSEATALISDLRAQDQRPVGYVAQRFRLREGWPEQDLSIREKLRWLVYRDSVGSEEADEVQLWIRLTQGG